MFGHDTSAHDDNVDIQIDESLMQPEHGEQEGAAVEIAATAPPASPAPAVDTSSNDSSVPSAASSEGTPVLPRPAAAPQSTDLLDIKQQALQSLTPLIGHLDQTDEEKFRTTMMMIQAADKQDLLPTAYETAQKITDEKVRAQALLDVINEINYFTQKKA